MNNIETAVEPRQRKPPIARVWKIAQPLLLIGTLVFVTYALYSRWSDVETAARRTTFHWGWIFAASGIVLATYAMLVESWRLLIRASGASLNYGPAVMIWTSANLGRYLPGKVWSVGALGVLAQRFGVPGFVAAGAAIIGTLLNLGAGFGITALTAWGSLDAFPRPVRYTAIFGGIAYVGGLALLPWILPPLVTRIARWRRSTVPADVPPVSTLWLAALLNSLSWIGYGIAFACFTRGAVPSVTGSPLLFIAVYAASYLAGYLALFAPGGIGWREAALATAISALGMATSPDAIVLGLLSRVWLTVLEIVPGLIGLGAMTLRKTKPA